MSDRPTRESSGSEGTASPDGGDGDAADPPDGAGGDGPFPEKRRVDGDALPDVEATLRSDGGPEVVRRRRVSDGGDSGDGGGTEDGAHEVGGTAGPERVVAERSVDEVFATFEEDTVEEVIATEDRHPGPEEVVVEDDVEDLFSDLPEAEAVGGGPATSVAAVSADEILERVRDTGSLFVEIGEGGPRRVVGESSVDEVFATFEEDTVEEVIAADDRPFDHPDPEPMTERSTATTTEKPGEPPMGDVNMDVGRDGAGGPPDADGDGEGETDVDERAARKERIGAALEDVEFEADDEGGVGAFVADEDDLVEATGEDTHRMVGESDVDEVFATFEEESVEEVIAAAETPGQHDAAPAETDGEVAGLFGDLSTVDLEPTPADERRPTAPAGPEETAREVEGLLADLSGMDVSGRPDPEETAREVEGLLADLSTVSIEEASADAAASFDAADLGPTEYETDLEPAETSEEPTILDPEEVGADSFQWLGEDVHILEGESDVEGMFEGFDEDSPEEIIETAGRTVPPEAAAAAARDVPGTSATALFADLAGDLPAEAPAAEVSPPAGWTPGAGDRAGTTDPADRSASALYDAIEPPEPIGVTPPAEATGTGTATEAAPDVEIDLDVGEAPETAGEDADDAAGDATDADAAESIDVPDLRSEIESGVDPEGGAGSETADAAGSETADAAGSETADATADAGLDEAGFEPATPTGTGETPDETGTATPPETTEESGDGPTPEPTERTETPTARDADASPAAGSESPAAGGESPGAESESPGLSQGIATDLGEEGGLSESGSVVGERDVDAVFERFEEDTVEEVIAADDEPARSQPEVSGDVEGLFGDLSTVELESGAAPESATREPAPDPGSQEAEDEVEGLLGDLSTIDLETADAAGMTGEPTATGESELGAFVGEPDELFEQTGTDSRRVVAESDVDAFFERFDEDTPQEIADEAEPSTDTDTAAARGESTADATPEAGTASPDAGTASTDAGTASTDAGTAPADGDPIEVIGPESDAPAGTTAGDDPSPAEGPVEAGETTDPDGPASEADAGPDAGGDPSPADRGAAGAGGTDLSDGIDFEDELGIDEEIDIGDDLVEEPADGAVGESGDVSAPGTDAGRSGEAAERSGGDAEESGDDATGTVREAADLLDAVETPGDAGDEDDDAGTVEDAGASSGGRDLLDDARDAPGGPATSTSERVTRTLTRSSAERSRSSDATTPESGGTGAERPATDATDAEASGDDLFSATSSGPGSETLFPDAAEASSTADEEDDEDESVFEAVSDIVSTLKRRVRNLL